ncbi:transposase family protein [Streptomyces sp. NPDC050287]|uniref:transposase family protein n=1 Tax=Streptomyces sp. NPDC050287 TaxID=3365608 RepID=UPI003789DDB5
MPAVLRCDQRPGDLAGGNGVHRTTVTRWVREVVGLLAARTPRLDRALKKITRRGGGIVLLDGSVIRTRRRTGTENRKNYSGKKKCHGLLVIALTDDRDRLLWISARPGRTSEITACRHDKLTQKLQEVGLGGSTVGRVDAGRADGDQISLSPGSGRGSSTSLSTSGGSWVSWRMARMVAALGFVMRPASRPATPRRHGMDANGFTPWRQGGRRSTSHRLTRRRRLRCAAQRPAWPSPLNAVTPSWSWSATPHAAAGLPGTGDREAGGVLTCRGSALQRLWCCPLHSWTCWPASPLMRTASRDDTTFECRPGPDAPPSRHSATVGRGGTPGSGHTRVPGPPRSPPPSSHSREASVRAMR